MMQMVDCGMKSNIGIRRILKKNAVHVNCVIFLTANYLGLFNYNTFVSIVIHIAILLPLAFTNAIFVDAERDGEKWLKEWKEEQSRYKLVVNRLKTKNLVMWNPNKEA
ncbi:hypothetical protein OAX34_03155 [Gammaproteobacteria bacterium]|nr:hypothetical protein [Gammaproteobacteria bacterium]MDC3384240.1 hypothetical protein [Gammaproteobacteria bacterium]